jgi:hypothetical protein
MTTPGSTPHPGRRRRRRSHSKSAPAPAPASAVSVLAEARAPALDESPDAPLTRAEVARMKVTLRFLHKHREILKLKVNAAEDLLLNGKREPTHRGLCQHLLSKLDRARVLLASERLPPAEATELLAGIVRFAPEIPYVVRFLQCVKVSTNRDQTAAALTQALERLDFGETSPAQMRDILLLIVDVFPARELPVFAFSLLNGEAFRNAFDRSSEGWPESLAALLVPLRALHRWILRPSKAGRRERRGAARASLAQLRQGARLLLGASPSSLLELSEGTRRRLFEVAADGLGVGLPDELGPAAQGLVDQFRGLSFRDASLHSQAAHRVVRVLLAAGEEKLARELLRAELEAGAEAREARRWLQALDGSRVGPLALEARRRGPGPADRWQRAWHVPSQRDVLVRIVEGSEVAALQTHVALLRRALVPGMAPMVSVVSAPERGVERAIVAVLWVGFAVSSRLDRGELDRALALDWCREACLLFGALSALGLLLPDAALGRFNVDAGGRLWLSDAWGLEEADAGRASGANTALARRFCLDVLGALELDPLSPVDAAALAGEASLPELLDVLERTSAAN